MAVALALRAGERYPDSPELAAVYTAAAWEPVGTAYAELVAMLAAGCGQPEVAGMAYRADQPV